MSDAHGPSFARPLAQSPRSEVLEWRLPRPFAHCVLTGRSRAAWHTSFVVPQLDLLLDAGLCVNRLRPRHVFLTHGHSDHTMLAPAFVRAVGRAAEGDEGLPDVHCPAEMAGLFDDFVRASVLLDGGGGGPAEDEEGGGEGEEAGEGDMDSEQDDNGHDGREEGQDSRRCDGHDGREEDQDSRRHDGHDGRDEGHNIGRKIEGQDNRRFDGDDTREDKTEAQGPKTTRNPTHMTHALAPGDTVPLRHLAASSNAVITATAFACDHSVPSLGYLFSRVTRRLRPSLAGVPGPRLGALAAAGRVITEPRAVPFLAFLGDSTAGTLAAAPAWLRAGVAVVVTECSFLYPRHEALADRTKHTAWCDLVHVVRRWPQTTFVLTHFSLRYSDADVVAFFTDMADCPGNIVVWADPLA